MKTKLATPFEQISDEAREYTMYLASFQRDHAKARVTRLIASAFENEDHATHAVDRLMQHGGSERVVAALTGEFQQTHFGFQRKAFLGFFASRRPDVRRALRELPDALRDLEEANNLVNDLTRAARAQHAERGNERAEERPRENTRDRSRRRTR